MNDLEQYKKEQEMHLLDMWEARGKPVPVFTFKTKKTKPSQRYANRVKKYIARFEQATNPRTKNHCAGMVLRLTRMRAKGLILDE